MGIEVIMNILVRGSFPTSLDELVVALRQAWDDVGLPGFLGLLIEALDTLLLEQWRRGELRPPECCATPAYAVRDRQHKSLRTSLGLVSFHWRRFCCRQCHHSWVPLREAFGLAPNQQASAELQQQVVNQCLEQSYRKVAEQLPTQVGEGAAIKKSAACTWVHRHQDARSPATQERAAPAAPPQEAPAAASEASPPEEPPAMREVDDPTRLPIVLADGTNFHQRAPAGQPGQTRGELRVVLGMTDQGRVFGIGVWSGFSWKHIGQQVGRQLTRAVCLVSDGELGLAEGLGPLTLYRQRCHWHIAHDLAYVLWQDHVSRRCQRRLQSLVARIIAVKLPPRSHRRGTPEDLAQLQEMTAQAEKRFERFCRYVERRHWQHTTTFLRRAQPEVFTYVRCFVDLGVRVPQTSNRIERMMETLARRLKHTGRNWSSQGAAQIADFIVQVATKATHWIRYWSDKVRIINKPQVEFQYKVVRRES